mmetsp:Transcript_15572/g.46712  ORF Transcript_15572/g.46712 Transcript_15572/m.46712 type:complete len:282 (+) Transcript_15572:1124-1969(+)
MTPRPHRWWATSDCTCCPRRAASRRNSSRCASTTTGTRSSCPARRTRGRWPRSLADASSCSGGSQVCRRLCRPPLSCRRARGSPRSSGISHPTSSASAPSAARRVLCRLSRCGATTPATGRSVDGPQQRLRARRPATRRRLQSSTTRTHTAPRHAARPFSLSSARDACQACLAGVGLCRGETLGRALAIETWVLPSWHSKFHAHRGFARSDWIGCVSCRRKTGCERAQGQVSAGGAAAGASRCRVRRRGAGGPMRHATHTYASRVCAHAWFSRASTTEAKH